jgi:hypothetical protein
VSLSPGAGPVTGNTVVVLSGVALSAYSSAVVAVTPAGGNSGTHLVPLSVQTASLATFTMPALAAGEYDVRLALNGQQFSAVNLSFLVYRTLLLPNTVRLLCYHRSDICVLSQPSRRYWRAFRAAAP